MGGGSDDFIVKIRGWLVAIFGLLIAALLAAVLIGWLLTPTPGFVPGRLSAHLENVTIIEPGLRREAV